jgi:acyl-CoA dehydrogenase
VGALGVTEPDTGSDVAAIKASARRDADGWVVNGSKLFITNGAWADIVVVVAKTDPEAGHEGITLFVVEAGSPGYSARKIPMLGWRSGQTGELSFAEVRIPDSHRLGEVGSGFAAIMRNFAWERLVMALGAVSGAQRIYEVAKAYALERSAFNRPIGKFQVWRHRFADMATRIEAARALTVQRPTADRLRGEPHPGGGHGEAVRVRRCSSRGGRVRADPRGSVNIRSVGA